MPAVTAPATSRMPVRQCAWTPVSQRNAVTRGTPGLGWLLPTGKLDSQPRARMRARSSAVGRHRVGMDRGQVLVGQRIADHRIVGRVGAPAEHAEGRRNPAGLDVELAVRATAGRARRRRRRCGRSRSSERNSPTNARRRAGCHEPATRDPKQPQRVVLVVGVIEERNRRQRRRWSRSTSPLTRTWPSMARTGPVGRLWATAARAREQHRQRDRTQTTRGACRTNFQVPAGAPHGPEAHAGAVTRVGGRANRLQRMSERPL